MDGWEAFIRHRQGREYCILERLKAVGFRYAIRSAGSHGAIDMLASNGLERIAVQFKKSKGLSSDEKSHAGGLGQGL